MTDTTLPPSPRMIELVEFVRRYHAANGYPPSTNDMARALGVGRVWCLRIARAAVDRGVLLADPGVARSWRAVPEQTRRRAPRRSREG